jgi:hypothetical protein
MREQAALQRCGQPTLFCTRKPYESEQAAQRALWAMKINQRPYADGLHVAGCKCGMWHIARAK